MSTERQTPPIIDVNPLAANDLESLVCVGQIHEACIKTGFFVAVGHGIDAEMAALFTKAQAFFALSQTDKERIPRINRYGFVPHRPWTVDQTRESAKNEYVDLGLGDEVDMPELAGFEDAVRGYQRVVLRVGSQILRAIATGLGIDPGFFASRMGDPQCRLRLLHYPAAMPDADGPLPVSTDSHTDYGVITLLATDGVPGLEVKPIDSQWIPVEAPAGSLVVNLGDMLARWSNDTFRSTPHRVVGPANGDRFSIPFFVNPDPATIIDCIPSCVTDQRPCRYEPVTAGDFLVSRIDSMSEPYIDRNDGPVRTINNAANR